MEKDIIIGFSFLKKGHISTYKYEISYISIKCYESNNVLDIAIEQVK